MSAVRPTSFLQKLYNALSDAFGQMHWMNMEEPSGSAAEH